MNLSNILWTKENVLHSSITESKEALDVINKFDSLEATLERFKIDLFEQWTVGIDKRVEENLKLCLLTKNSKSKELQLNFNPEVSTAIVTYFS